MNSNIVLLGLLYLLYAEEYINLTQVLLLLALLSTTVNSCRDYDGNRNNNSDANNIFNT